MSNQTPSTSPDPAIGFSDRWRLRFRSFYENSVLALQTLRDRSFRSFLTIMGVFIGVVIIIGVASVLNGFRQGVIDQIEQFGTNNIYITRFPMMGFGRPKADLRKRKLLNIHDVWALRDECPAIGAISPLLAGFQTITVKYGKEEMVGPNLRGVYPSMSDVMDVHLTDGRFFTAEENVRREDVCVIGAAVVDALFPRQNPVGKQISLNGQSLRVIGTMAQFKSGFGDENPEDSLVMIPYFKYRDLFPYIRDHVIAIRARTGQLSAALEQIEEVMRRRRHVAWNDQNDFEMGTSQSLIETFDKIVFATLAVMFALSAVAFLVGGVGVMNVMLASVKERTREIGVRRAIGARRRDITWQFLVEAMVMTGTGGILGVFIGRGLLYMLSTFLPSLPCATPLWAQLFGFFGSIGVGLIFGLWPAISAARLDPIRALRYE